jgi:hypothetical protein
MRLVQEGFCFGTGRHGLDGRVARHHMVLVAAGLSIVRAENSSTTNKSPEVVLNSFVSASSSR